jgi:hypothetical protein
LKIVARSRAKQLQTPDSVTLANAHQVWQLLFYNRVHALCRQNHPIHVALVQNSYLARQMGGSLFAG